MILLASVIAPHKLSEGYALKWLEYYEAMRDSVDELQTFLAVEVDSRGLEPFAPLMDRLNECNVTIWTFSLDKAPLSDEPYEVTSGDRLIRICIGRNLAIEYAIQNQASHILHVDTDTEPTPDCLPRLLEVNRPLVFGHVPTYGLRGSSMPELPGDCQQHWSSAGFALVRRDVFRHVRWGWDLDAGKTDDPTFARDVELMGNALGEDWRPVTRHDVVGTHHPQSIVPLENRPVDRFLR